MLTTVESVLRMPGMGNTAALPTVWLNDLIGEADAGIKMYLKRDIELTAYQEYYSGDSTRDIVLRQWPVILGKTTIAAASNGAVLPQPIVNVASTSGFHPGTGGDTSLDPPTIAVQTGVATWSTITYTGTTATSFTGCSGGTGVLSSSPGSPTAPTNGVFSPVVWLNMSGYYGQAADAFKDQTVMGLGSQFILNIDSGGKKSNRGTIRRIGGQSAGWVGFYPENLYSGKLGAYRMPAWPRGDGNIKVCYSAGYPLTQIPLDIVNACKMLVAIMIRICPVGAPVSSENLGGYSYTLLTQSTDIPELGSIQRTLARHREISW